MAQMKREEGPDREPVSAALLSALARPNGAPGLQIYVDGSWHDASDGRTFDSYEPATGRVWATVAEAGPEDVDAAVRAARRAFEGSWGSTRAMDRARVLYRIAEKIEAHKEDLVRIESRDNGKALRETRKESGYGRENGIQVMEHYTQTKSIWVDLQETPPDWFAS